ncbi:protein Wnt-16 isoform X2 [Nilaparvata lugens]|uniref:protein Wnt-16 isoform X2 n=1 Tax=Nilaparvata lugens TaxID=108931 RepID=UPI00193CBFB8|nr:protein Wnt-16 isoform X2 [Nilaparvata lugens]UTS77844.1 Wnt16 [Nilaparvata lugens]
MSCNSRTVVQSIVVLCVVVVGVECGGVVGGGAPGPNWMYLGVTGVGPPMQRNPAAGGPETDDAETAEAKAVCSAIPGLVAQQVDVCLDHPDTIRSVADGARRAIDECQHQFRNERWNCSTGGTEDQSVFGYVLERGSKETAFVYAVTSAGVVYAVTHACSSGNLTECNCDVGKQGQTTPEGWKWGGCSDNLQYGIQFARRFVDAPERIKPSTAVTAKAKRAWSVRTRMNIHNNEVGRQTVATLMRVQCRCHGVSGSCELKTCWKTMPSFDEVGDLLKRKYRTAVQVNRGSILGVSHNKRGRPRRKRKAKRRIPLAKADLVHIHKSPDYCVHDPNRGILGTQGRVCNKTSNGPDSCDLLCCGRGYNTQVIKRVERCHCKFVWCCYVKCKTCETLIDQHTCK